MVVNAEEIYNSAYLLIVHEDYIRDVDFVQIRGRWDNKYQSITADEASSA